MSWFTFPWFRKSKPRPIRKNPPRFRPMVEILEDRITPATHTWAGPASGGLWSSAANWSGGVPTTGESGGTIVVFGSGITSIDDISGLIVDEIEFNGAGNVIKGSSGNSLGINATGIVGNNILDNAGNNLIDSSLSLFTTSGGLPAVSVNEAPTSGTLKIASSWLGTSTQAIEAEGPGTVILTGNSPGFSPSFGVSAVAGTLEVNANFSGASLSATGATSGVQVTLRGTGTGKSITVNCANGIATLAPGTPSNTGILSAISTGFLTINGTTSFPAQVQMRVHGFTPGSSYDQLAAGAQLQIGSVSSNPVDLTVDFTGLAAGGTAHIITAGSWNGNKFANVTFNNLPAGLSAQVVFNPADNPNGVDVVVSGGTQTPNEIYVTNLYKLLLNRAPDTQGFNFWVGQLNAGASPSSVVLGFEQSPEYLNDLVNTLYEHYLGRTAVGDPGASFWVNELENNFTIEQVTSGILASPEFFQDAGSSNKGFVDLLYQDVLDRAADSGGESFWLQQLANGVSRQSVALGFLTTTEYRQDLVAGVGWTPTGGQASTAVPFFEGYYLTYLLRQGDPQGVAAWVGGLQGGLTDQQVLAGILGSVPEGFDLWSH